jgi:predicted O-linked N-acetylglucosamine transferase (SPINDLY family)
MVAVNSWLLLGFHVISVNSISEINQLSPLFPGVTFVPASRSATPIVGKPLIYLDDLLAALKESGASLCGLINSDIVLYNCKEFPAFLEYHRVTSLVYGPRLDVDTVQKPEGVLYQCGRDYFFFDHFFINLVPTSSFSIGSPWWDIWLPLVAEHSGYQLIQPLDWIALHKRHSRKWDGDAFWIMGGVLLDLIRQHDFSVQKNRQFEVAADLMIKQQQDELILLLYGFLAERTLVFPLSLENTIKLTASVSLDPSARFSLIFPCLAGKDGTFICDRIVEIEQFAYNREIEIIIIIENWHADTTLNACLEALAIRYRNITSIRLLAPVCKQMALDAASRFAHGTTVLSLDSGLPYYSEDPCEMDALRTYYKKLFYKQLKVCINLCGEDEKLYNNQQNPIKTAMNHDKPDVMKAAQRFIAISVEKVIKLHEAGYTDEAIAQYADLLSLYPDNDEIAFRLAKLYQVAGRTDEAIPLLQRVTSSSPYFAESLHLVGMMLGNKSDFAGAADYLTRFLEFDDSNVECYNNLARFLIELGRSDEAFTYLTKSIQVAPDHADTYNYLGGLFLLHWRFAEAGEQYRRVAEIQPGYSSAYNNLAWVATLEGRSADAVALYLKALELDPHFRIAADNYLFALNYFDAYTPEQVRDEHFRLADMYNFPVGQHIPRHHQQGDIIRVGYVSADFKAHSVAFFFEPVLSHHNRACFEIFCYDLTPVPDETTARLMNLGWEWRRVYGLSDGAIAEQVRADAIDILVDLSGHTKDNRLGVFALCPAPVQVTWLGYPNTTGLKQIDYRLTDELSDPSGVTDHLYAEQLVRLPRSFLCYEPPLKGIEIAPLPQGPIRFCCFNNYPKISDTVISLWARLLKALPDSLISIKNGSLNDIGVRERLIDRFASWNIDPSRLTLCSLAESREEHLRRYGTCHIALDTYPYTGTTTTCEALWMGVPVVTLAGATHASRVGVSLLVNAGLSELVAESGDQYVSIALDLALNRERLLAYRHSLRTIFSQSPLSDAPGFTVNLERSYQWMMSKQ